MSGLWAGRRHRRPPKKSGTPGWAYLRTTIAAWSGTDSPLRRAEGEWAGPKVAPHRRCQEGRVGRAGSSRSATTIAHPIEKEPGRLKKSQNPCDGAIPKAMITLNIVLEHRRKMDGVRDRTTDVCIGTGRGHERWNFVPPLMYLSDQKNPHACVNDPRWRARR
jgi:hypothetical protein